MLIEKISFSKFCGPILVAGLAPFTLHAQHVHGVAELGVVVEGSTLGVTFEAPLADVIGFEHAPENDEQIASIRRAAEVLENPANLFGAPTAANCTVSRQSIDAPDYFLEAASGEAHDHDEDGEHGHDEAAAHDEHEHEHDDHDEAMAHDDDHEHDGDGHDEAMAHDDDHEHGEDHDGHGASHHSNLLASYEWTCGNIDQLNNLTLSIASQFGSVETVNVQILTPTGVFADELPGGTESISLTPQ